MLERPTEDNMGGSELEMMMFSRLRTKRREKKKKLKKEMEKIRRNK